MARRPLGPSVLPSVTVARGAGKRSPPLATALAEECQQALAPSRRADELRDRPWDVELRAPSPGLRLLSPPVPDATHPHPHRRCDRPVRPPHPTAAIMIWSRVSKDGVSKGGSYIKA
ncbi:hypothetical protein AAFF_G00343820 [Aldrovandia affinis]|uniref:Uncharacterized protein n=1 Tax=Aldrovandia affinis TaxID=143900 RepID=A0AAD7SL41_9TELE|nr:hypothetical protein AAFF_G00343820 [Aldrovandia affinis]